MKTIKNDYCIRMFVGHDDLRPVLNNVNIKDGYLYSTDAHIVAKIKADLCIHKYTAVEKYPDTENPFNNHNESETKTISVENLFHELIKIECCFKPKLVKCDECNGDGVVTCDHCGSDYDCKECNGTGEMKSDELVLSGEYNCNLFNRKYRLQYLDMIIKVAVITGVNEIIISNGKTNFSGTMFFVGDFHILLMPLNIE